ncbi:CHAT domain-containing protein [Chloroflexi bacterium TSY]|nr:CHAT domain-containing protein [Chloroflexi bacterium TSY]
MTDSFINAVWLDELLALQTFEEQIDVLQKAELLDELGIDSLLDETEKLARRNPGQARQLAVCCRQAATHIRIPTLVPRALYLEAQSHAINGDFATANELIVHARALYTDLGMVLESIRTNAGLMRVLGEQGRFQDALDVGQSMLNRAEILRSEEGKYDPLEIQLIIALAHAQRGMCFIYSGRYQEALSALDNAERQYRVLDMPERIAMVSNNRGLALLYLGRASEALHVFQSLAHIQENAGLHLPQAHTQSNLGEVYLLLGNYTASLMAYERSQTLLKGQDTKVDQQINLRQMADTYLALNLYDEALAAFCEVEAILGAAGMVYEQAWALWGMGATRQMMGQLDEAQSALTKAAALFAKVGNAPLRAGVMTEESAVIAHRGQQEVAVTVANHALELASQGDWPVQQFFAHLQLADLQADTTALVETHLQAAATISQKLNLPHLRYRVEQRLGRLRLTQNQRAEAERLLTNAVKEIEALRNTLARETMRTSFLRDKIAAYDALLSIYIARNDEENIQRAFDVTERARARTLLDRISGALSIESSSELPREIGERLHQLQADLNAIYNDMLDDGSDRMARESGTLPSGDRNLRFSELQTRAVYIEQIIKQLTIQVPLHEPTSTSFATPLSLVEIQAQLSPDTQILSYYILEDEIIAFVVGCNSIHMRRWISSTEAIEQLLNKFNTQLEVFRAGDALVNRHMVHLERTTLQILNALYCELLEPLVSMQAISLHPSVRSVPKLIIVPHGLLHHVPFHALYDGQQHLLARYVLSFAPSATVLAICLRRSLRQTGQALIMGVAEADIPAVEEEVAIVAQQVGDVTVYLNEQATMDVFASQAASSRLLHLACHGLFRADNPLFSALKLADGWLADCG